MTAHHWIRATYSIALDFNTRRGPKTGTLEVDGLRHDLVPIGMHLTAHATLDITHIPSGKRIASFTQVGAGIEFMERIVFLTDEWFKDEPAISEELTEVIVTLAAELGV